LADLPARATISLRPRLRVGWSGLPAPGRPDRASRRRTGAGGCATLHAVGFAVPRRSRAGRWAFTPPFHPCLIPRNTRAIGGLFSVALSRAPNPGAGGCYPPPCPAVLGLSSERATPAGGRMPARGMV